jgi:hypothetical protein
LPSGIRIVHLLLQQISKHGVLLQELALQGGTRPTQGRQVFKNPRPAPGGQSIIR